jgi:hypothetical protein
MVKAPIRARILDALRRCRAAGVRPVNIHARRLDTPTGVDLSTMLAEREADWQQHVDEQHLAAVGADAMQKAMMLASVIAAVKKANSEAGIEI